MQQVTNNRGAGTGCSRPDDQGREHPHTTGDLERVCDYARAVDLLGRWWNGHWGRLARRDIWLSRTVQWQVTARRGNSEVGQVLRWEFDDETAARTMVARLQAAPGSGSWREQDPSRAAPPP